MLKLIIVTITPIAIFASYNPFFQENPKQRPQNIQKPIIKTILQKKILKPKAIPQRKNIAIVYFGFIETDKGRFALVSFQDKNIVIKANDSLYIDEEIFKVTVITSNYIVVKDRYSRVQTVYFSSQDTEKEVS